MSLNDISIRNAVRAYTASGAVAFLVVGGISAWELHSFAATVGAPAADAASLVVKLAAIGLVFLSAGAVWLFRHVSARIDLVGTQTENLRAGDCDLTRRLPKMTGGLGRVCSSLNAFVGQIQDLVASVMANAGQIATAARQISAGNTELSSRTEKQASTLEETASSMEQFTASVKQNADNTRLARDLAASASTAAQRGGKVASEAVAKITAANESSRKIGAIVAAIDSIAFQTNILALNAAVEAARAGEQGRGFAVVAAEVRELAQRSAASAKEVKALVTNAVAQVDVGAKLVSDAGSAMQEIIAGIEQAAAVMNEIATVTAQQAAGIEQVNRAILQLEGGTQQNAALVEQAAAAAGAMREQAESLTILVSRFKIDERKAREVGHRVAQDVAQASARPIGKPPRRDLTAPRTRSLPSRASGATADAEWTDF